MDIKSLLDSSKNAVIEIGKEISNNISETSHKEFFFDPALPKEIKAKADKYIEEKIIKYLSPLGISILSEELGLLELNQSSEMLFVLDPLDGTYNFIRGSGPSCISLALWEGDKPIFGIIYDINSSQITWGGSDIGSFSGDKKILVSESESPGTSVIASGFPVRFNPKGQEIDDFYFFLNQFAKVRMIGSAAMSLNYVSNGFYDAYFERDIMFWDVAAGLAILEGAGGQFKSFQKEKKYSLDVFATNKLLINKVKI